MFKSISSTAVFFTASLWCSVSAMAAEPPLAVPQDHEPVIIELTPAEMRAEQIRSGRFLLNEDLFHIFSILDSAIKLVKDKQEGIIQSLSTDLYSVKKYGNTYTIARTTDNTRLLLFYVKEGALTCKFLPNDWNGKDDHVFIYPGN